MPTSVGPSANQSDEDFLGTGEGIPLLLHCTRLTDNDHHDHLGHECVPAQPISAEGAKADLTPI